MDLIKPKKLHKGSTVAAVSPSWGAAGAPDIHWKYRRLIQSVLTASPTQPAMPANQKTMSETAAFNACRATEKRAAI